MINFKLKIILVTSNELRHRYIQTFVYNLKKITTELIIEEQQNSKKNLQKISKKQKEHFKLRNFSEKKFFKRKINHKIKKIKISKLSDIEKNKTILKKIMKIKPDIILCFGCSIFKKSFINRFKGKLLNIHLGLSPYYRGQGTNFWPFVNNELQFIGATFHLIDYGIDTGPIIHQVRAKIFKGDNVHSIGNRLIRDLTKSLKIILENFQNFGVYRQMKSEERKYYESKDFNDYAIEKLLNNYKKNVINNYLNNKMKLIKKFPIVINKKI